VERTTIAGETEELGENLPQRHFVPPQIRFRTPDRSDGKPAINHLSYGAAWKKHLAMHALNSGNRSELILPIFMIFKQSKSYELGTEIVEFFFSSNPQLKPNVNARL
jgi:hypothetical protein